MKNEPYPDYDETYGGKPLKLNKLPSLEQNGVDEYKSKKRKKKRKKSPRKSAAATQTVIPKRIDYVLVYPKEDEADYEDADDIEDCQRRAELRKRFQKAAKETEGLEIREKDMVDKKYVLIHCPFSRMCHQAESVNLEMPLEGAAIPKTPQKGCMHKITSLFVTEDEVDFISAPFCVAKRAVFQGIDEPDTFFSPALRSLLVHNILINIDVREKGDTEKNYKDSMRRKAKFIDQSRLEHKQGLPFMLMKKVFTDAFIMHEESLYELVEDDDTREIQRSLSKEKGDFDPKADPREGLHRTWCRSFKFQPLWKIRNYFGEKIAFYFAWAGEMASLLWFPVLMGLAIWGYGLYLSIKDYMDVIERRDEILLQREALIDELRDNITLYNRTEDIELVRNLTSKQEDSVFSNIADTSLELLGVFQNSFDSEVTPYFALIICLWGTVFQESWKRKHARLAYEWDVDTYHFSEPDRPEFYGTKERDDPVSSLPDWYYPFHKQFLKFMASFGILVFMALLVVASVLGVIIYRVISAAILSESSSVLRLLASTVVATLLNSISIMILGRIYDYIAYKLTDWENHRTQSQYDDALIIKLFAFQFVNSYASLFYIAFFRGLTHKDGILYLGEGYTDSCGEENNCMALLSLQVFVLMIIKPFPKFLKDVILPWLIKNFKKCCCCGKNKVSDIEASELEKADFLKREAAKPQLGNFTLGEFTEKTIQYGFLMLFSCALPLAPLIAILVLLVDIRVDARRMLWMNRRPIPFISGGIGMWYSILDFLNFAGVVTNAFLIAFTAQWSKDFSIYDKLWIVIGFEHLVLSVKFFIAYVIPDVPADISLSMRRQRYQISQIMENASNQGPVKSKAGTPVKLAPDFKAYNFVDCDVDNQLGCDNNSADSGQLGNGIDNKRRSLEEHNSDDERAGYNQLPLDTYVPNLSYAPDGNTYLDQSTKFPETKKKKKKKVKKQPSEEIPDDNTVSPHAQLVYPTESDYLAYNNNAEGGIANYPSVDAVYPPQSYSLDYAPEVPNPVYPPSTNYQQNSFF